MEVHHPHHPTHKKKWTEYLLEFLMLFLAVFLGFIAENAREHIAERKKEKYLIRLLKQDLIKDTANLHKLIFENTPLNNKFMDSASRQMISIPIRENEKILIAMIENGTTYSDFSPSEIALSEFRYGGVLDLIRKPVVKEAIFSYTSQINYYDAFTSGMHQAEWAVDTSVASFFSIHDDERLLKITFSINSFRSLTPNDIPDDIHFETYDPNDFKRLAIKIKQLSVIENEKLGVAKRVYGQAIALLAVLNKEYPDISV